MLKVVFTKDSLKSYLKIPANLRNKIDTWIDLVETRGINKARESPGYKDHRLVGDRVGQRSIRLNRTWRLVYVEKEDIIIVEIHAHKY